MPSKLSAQIFMLLIVQASLNTFYTLQWRSYHIGSQYRFLPFTTFAWSKPAVALITRATRDSVIEVQLTRFRHLQPQWAARRWCFWSRACRVAHHSHSSNAVSA